MGFGIDFKADIFLSRIYEDDIDNKISESEHIINEYEKSFLQYATATPVFTSAEEQSKWLHDISTILNDELESYKENIILLYNLKLYKNETSH